jgi:uncharacterized protein DUF1707
MGARMPARSYCSCVTETQQTSVFRASDEDREGVARTLRAHLAEGRLTLDEFSERIERTFRAKSVDELRSLVADLPILRTAAPSPATQRPPRLWPGNLPFSTRIFTPADIASVRASAMRTVVPELLADGYRMSTHSSTTLVLDRTHRPGWTIFLAVFGFPLGLIALLYKDESQVVIQFERGDHGTRVQASGTARRRVRRAVRELANEAG